MILRKPCEEKRFAEKKNNQYLCGLKKRNDDGRDTERLYRSH